jgi:hypothetical protein
MDMMQKKYFEQMTELQEYEAKLEEKAKAQAEEKQKIEQTDLFKLAEELKAKVDQLEAELVKKK